MWETIAASEALLGVIIGGIIGLVGSVMLLVVDARKWRSDRKLEHLRIKRRDMEARFLRLREILPDAMAEAPTATMGTEILDLTMRCPKRVEVAIVAYVKDDAEMDAARQRDHYYNITTEMTVVLRELEQQIDDAV